MSANERLAQIKSRLAAATPGPWEYERGNVKTMTRPVCYLVATSACYEDGDFIANAPTDIAWLVAENERLSGELAVARTNASLLRDACVDVASANPADNQCLSAALASVREALSLTGLENAQ